MLEFKITEAEEKMATQFRELHKNCSLTDCEELKEYYTGPKWLWKKLTGKPLYKIKPGPYPEHFSYSVSSGSGIGQGLDIKCNYCGESLDITDYGCW